VSSIQAPTNPPVAVPPPAGAKGLTQAARALRRETPARGQEFALPLRLRLQSSKAHLAEIGQALGIVVPDEALIRDAGDLAERLGLRGYDSAHLSAAYALASRLDPAVDYRFAAFDKALLEVARSLSLRSVDPGGKNE